MRRVLYFLAALGILDLYVLLLYRIGGWMGAGIGLAF